MKYNSAIILLLFTALLASDAQAFFYRAESMQHYCEDYLKREQVEIRIDEYNAGICAGYMASKLEFLKLTDRLCSEQPLNLDEVIGGFIEYMKANPQLREQSSTRAVVSYLDANYTCK